MSARATTHKKWITRAEAAEIYSVHVDTIDAARKAGLIRAKRVGKRRINLEVASLDEWIEGLVDA